MKYSDLPQTTITHTMVYGDTGTGKTTLLMKLLEKFELIWVSADNGHAKIANKMPKEWLERLDIIVIPDTRDYPVAFTTVRKLMKGTPTIICHQHGTADCKTCTVAKAPTTTYEFRKNSPKTIVVLDHLSSITDSAMAVICKGKKPNAGEDYYKPVLDDYGALKFWMSELMKDIEKAPFNIACIAQTMESTLEDGKKKILPSVGSYEFGRLVGQHFDHLVYCELSSLSHKFGSSTTYSATAVTRSRDDIAIEKEKAASLLPFFHYPSQQEMAAWEQRQAVTLIAAPVVRELSNSERAQENKGAATVAIKASKSAAELLAELKAKKQGS